MNASAAIAAPRVLLRVRNLSATFGPGGEAVRVFDTVSFEVRQGEIIDVTGPSGSGKSTLLRAIARLLPHVSGDLDIEGASPEGPQEWRRTVALVPQKPVMAPGTVRANLELPWTLKVAAGDEAPSDAEMRAALDDVGLPAIDLDRPAAKLSVGQLARVGLVRTLLTRPVALLLDEIDAPLDDESSALVSAVTREFVSTGEPRCVVRVRHRGSDGLATRRLRLSAGRLEEVAD